VETHCRDVLWGEVREEKLRYVFANFVKKKKDRNQNVFS